MLSEITYMLNGNTQATITLKPGDIVQGATPNQAEFQMEKRHKRDHPAEQLAWMQVHGVTRAAVLGRQLCASGKPATVPQ